MPGIQTACSLGSFTVCVLATTDSTHTHTQTLHMVIQVQHCLVSACLCSVCVRSVCACVRVCFREPTIPEAEREGERSADEWALIVHNWFTLTLQGTPHVCGSVAGELGASILQVTLADWHPNFTRKEWRCQATPRGGFPHIHTQPSPQTEEGGEE